MVCGRCCAGAGHFIDDQLAAADEELDAHGADVAELFGDAGGDPSASLDAAGGARRHDGDIEDALGVLVSPVGEAGDPAVLVARQDHRHFVVERQALFEHAGSPLKAAKAISASSAVGDALALAVVAKAGDLEDGRGR